LKREKWVRTRSLRRKEGQMPELLKKERNLKKEGRASIIGADGERKGQKRRVPGKKGDPLSKDSDK